MPDEDRHTMCFVVSQTADPELLAIEVCSILLEPLYQHERERVVRYVADRWGAEG